VTYDQYETPEYFHGGDGDDDGSQQAKKRRLLRRPRLSFKRS
jgi:hypothetical protein